MNSNWETKSECGDIRKNKNQEQKIEKNNSFKKPQDDLPCKQTQIISTENTIQKSNSKSNLKFPSQNIQANSTSNIELQNEGTGNQIMNRKLSIMSFEKENEKSKHQRLKKSGMFLEK